MIHLVASLLTRALREGLIVRALAWPGLLTALAILVSAAAVALVQSSESVATSDVELAEELEAHGLVVEIHADPEAALLAEDVDRAIWMNGQQSVLGLRHSGRTSLLIEAVLRDHVGSAWTIELPPIERRDERMGPVTRLLMGMMAALFTLYGVVFGAASVLRDREDGTLEAERSLPVAEWTHGAARLAAAAALLGVGFALSLGLLHGLLSVDEPLAWLLVGCVAGLSGAAIGLGAMSRAETLSRPLALGMSASMLLLGLGWSLPDLGRHLPIAAVGALVRGELPSAVSLLTAALLSVVACLLFARSLR